MTAAKLKWTRALDKYDSPVWTSGEYRIERQHFSIPTRSIGYSLHKGDKRLWRYPFDTLAEAKEWAQDDTDSNAEVVK